jgi:hypothetical protein
VERMRNGLADGRDFELPVGRMKAGRGEEAWTIFVGLRSGTFGYVGA